MRCTAIILAGLLVLASGPAQSASSEEPAFVYQRIHALVAHHDNRITLRVWEDGRLEIRFPAYTPRAGLYRGRLEQAEVETLEQMVSMLAGIQPDPLFTRLNQVRSSALIEVADADIVRFIHTGPDRQTVELRTPAPDAWSSLAPEVGELRELEQLEKNLRAWMDQQMKGLERQP